MKDNTHTHLLWQFARHITDDPRFTAYTLARTADPAATLGLDDDQLARLALCKRPRRDSQHVADVVAIVANVGVDADRLAALLR